MGDVDLIAAMRQRDEPPPIPERDRPEMATSTIDTIASLSIAALFALLAYWTRMGGPW